MNFRHVFPNQRQDESIYVFVRPYYLAFLPWFGLGLILVLLGLMMITLTIINYPELLQPSLGYNTFVIISSAYFLLLLPFITVAFIDFYYDIHIVTDRRLVDIDQRALFSREINELALEEVQDVTSTNRGILGSIFDFGDVVIETSSAQQKFEFNSVLHPREIAGIILDLSDQAKRSIEGGTSAVIMPHGEAKGVINGQVITEEQKLEKIGAVVPHEPNTPPVPKSEHIVEVAGKIIEDDIEKPQPQTSPEQPTTPKDSLDIIIDDPTKK